jgi:phytoene dehydrogenase-like protein
VRMVALREDAPALTFWADPERTAEGLRPVAPADADAYPRFDAHLRELAGFVAEVQTSTPPRLDRAALHDAAAGLRLARAYRRLGARAARELTRVVPMAVADLVGEWFADDSVRAAVAVRGTQFTAMGPWSAGTALVLLADSAGNDGGAAGQTAFVRGGPAAPGAEVRTGAEVVRVMTRDGHVEGVELASGEELSAPAVACAVDPKTVLVGWLDPVVAGPRLRWRAGNIRTPGATARLDLALTGLPRFTGVDDERALHGRLVFAPGIDAVEQAFDAWKYGRVSERPALEATIPTLSDPGSATAGHRMTVLAQWVPYAAEPDEVAERVLAVLERHAPGIGGLIGSTAVLTPAGIEREYGLAGGHLYHAEPALDQFFAWRPVIGLARHRLGVRGLYLCGAGAHPGGGITGGPGRNAAREILRDLRRAG